MGWARYLLVLAVSCSGTAPEYDLPVIEPERMEPAEDNLTPTSAVQCSDSCQLAFPTAAGRCDQQTTQAACDAFQPGWFGTQVPACGKTALWQESCYWSGTACSVASYYLAWQTCSP